MGVQSYSWIEHGMTKCTSFRDTPLIRVPNQCLCHRYTILGLFDLDKYCYWLLRGQTLLPKSLYIIAYRVAICQEFFMPDGRNN